MNKKDDQFKKHQEELNQKIESIMGPTQSGEKPYDETNMPGTAPLVTQTPAKEKPETPAPKPAEVIKPDSTKTDAAVSEGPKDEELDEAVDDIAASDSDEVLLAEDQERERDAAPPPKRTTGEKIKDFFKAWWGNPKARNATLIIMMLIIAGLAVYPTSRYYLLNLATVRSKASVTVLDNSTQQPLKNVEVTVANQTGKTDDNGYVQLQKVKLGKTNLVVKKRAFAPITKEVTVGWGSNPLGQQKVDPTGVQYTFYTTDFLSNKPIEKAEASSGESSAFSDKDGKIVLTLDQSDVNASSVKITADKYRDEQLPLSDNVEQKVSVKMVPSHKHAFVSKRSGKYDVYKIDVDGTNEQVAFAGSGTERDDMVLAPHPSQNLVAVVSTHDNQRNNEGFLLSNLNLVNLDDNKVSTIATSEQIQVVGWADGKFVFVQIAQGASGNNPKRQRLMSYDPDKKELKELAAANYFNDVALVANTIYYAPAAAFQNGSDTSLFKVDPDGNNRQTVYQKETWNIFRTNYDQMIFAAQQDWFQYNIGSNTQPTKIVPPANPKTRVYINNPANKRSVWVDQRDGKGALIIYNVDDKKETTLQTQSGLKYPVSWVSDNTLVYRINTDQETADYVLNVEGGQPRKIKDVTNTGGIDKWYYY